MLNRVTIMGRLTADPDVRATANGVVVSNFSLAVDRDYLNKNTEKRETDFIDVTVWRALAEFAARFLQKGTKVVVDGRLETNTRTSKEGVKYRNVYVVAENIYFCEAKRKTDDGEGEAAGRDAPIPEAGPTPAEEDVE